VSCLRRTPIDIQEVAQTLHQGLDRFASADFVDWLINNSFFSYDIGEYLSAYRDAGLVIGCRLHSNLLSLAQGVPSFFLIYDERTREIAELFDVPRCNLMDFDESVDPLSYSWSACEKNYALYFEELRRFFDENGLRHNLKLPDEDPEPNGQQ
jgi:hypothetical protein